MIEEPMPETYFVTIEDVRPRGAPGTCFYCGRDVGDTHTLECVCRSKQVLVRMVIEYPIIVPADWDEHLIETHRNESGWCIDNALSELEELHLCQFSYYQVVRPDDPIPLNSLGDPYLDRDWIAATGVHIDE